MDESRQTLAYVSFEITGNNQFSEWVFLHHDFNFSLMFSQPGAGKITLQKSYDGGSIIIDVSEYTASTAIVLNEPEVGAAWRFGCKQNDYNTGSIAGRLSQ